MTLFASPRELGWRPVPAWAVPGRFWLAWPGGRGDRERDETAREDCLGLAELLSDFAPVSLICSSREAAEVALRTPPNVAALAAEHDGTALRVHAPLWLMDRDGRVAGAVPFSPFSRELAERAGVAVVDPPAGLPRLIESDGEGAMLVAVPPDQRNVAEALLRDWLGLDCAIWLEPPAEVTHWPGARFLAPGLVVVPPHPANYRALEAATDARGRRFTLVELPNAKHGDGCYADCLVAGPTVIVPDFEDGRGTEAFARVSVAAVGRRVAAFPASLLASGASGLGTVVAVQPATL